MDGIHDLGGMQGFGEVEVQEDAPLFHRPWERRVFGLLNLALGAGLANVDKFRHAIERMPPAEYLNAGYYGRWLRALETLVAEAGLSEGRSSLSPPEPTAVRKLERSPRFTVGERVRARRLFKSGHCRLPGYARGRLGAIADMHPAFVFPDTNAHDEGENPQFLYSVAFAGCELWGESCDPGVIVHVDLFEDYLEATNE